MEKEFVDSELRMQRSFPQSNMVYFSNLALWNGTKKVNRKGNEISEILVSCILDDLEMNSSDSTEEPEGSFPWWE